MTLTRALPAIFLTTVMLGLSGCGDDSGGDSGGDSSAEDTIRVGTSPGPYSELFEEVIGPILEDEGYTLEHTSFSELQQADVAMDEGSIDLNVDQHTAYMDVFNEETGAELTSVTEVPTVPAGLFSSTHEDLDEVADGHTVGIPQDASNQSRAYNILAEAGWITLSDDADPVLVTASDIEGNPHDLDIQTMDSATIPRSLDDLDWGVIPGSISYSSGVDTDQQYFQETLRDELILVAVVREEDEDSQWAQDVAEAYSSDQFSEYMDEENENDYWFIPESLQ